MPVRPLSNAARGELLVAGARVVVIAAALPTAVHIPTALALVGTYAIFAVAMLAAVWFTPAILRWRRATLVVDFVIAAALNAVLPGAALFAFLAVAAAIRFDWRRTLFIIVAELVVFVATDLALYRYLLLETELIPIAAFIVALAFHRDRLHDDLLVLGALPHRVGLKTNELTAELIEAAALRLHVDDAVLVRSDADGRHARMTVRNAEEISTTTAPPLLEDAIAFELRAKTFCTKSDGALVLNEQSHRGHAVASDLLDHFGARHLLTAPINTPSVSGRLLFFGRTFDAADLRTADALASTIGARLEQHTLIRSLRERSQDEERTRLACELHDGPVQTLATVRMQVGSLEHSIAKRPEEVPSLIATIDRTISEAQMELRDVVTRELRPKRNLSLRSNVRMLAEDFASEGLDFDVHVDPIPSEIPGEMRRQVERLVREAVSNVARHASATHVTVHVTLEGETMRITISDDGTGLPFHGRYDLAELMKMDGAPKSLTRRVATLGGNLTLDSGDDGTRVEILLPVGEAT